MHFVVNIDNGRILEFRGDTTIKYVEVVSSRDSMTMVIRISEGQQFMIKKSYDDFYKCKIAISYLWSLTFVIGQGLKVGWTKLYFLNILVI